MDARDRRISPTQEITLKLTDAKSGVPLRCRHHHRNNQSLVILDKVFSEPAPVQTTSFNIKNAGLRDGAFELEITARDNSLMSFGKGNGTTRKWNMQLDTQPPKVRIKTTVPALRRGSVTAIAYSVSEDASMTGVQLGEQFFPAFLQPNGLYYCFFPFPLDTPKRKVCAGTAHPGSCRKRIPEQGPRQRRGTKFPQGYPQYQR